ncbi:MAG TPA: hypothetical protein VGN20_22895 [Mucilaginibacter sp.]|jgi:hypothetical protein
MATTPKLTILTFPQELKGNVLTLNALIIPRNIDPLNSLIKGLGGGVPDAPAFAAANLVLQAKVIPDLSEFPSDLVASTPFSLMGVGIPATATDVFNTLAAQFDISVTDDQIKDPVKNQHTKKYLPLSYRNSFNFTNPRTPYAITDDAYECAVRDGKIYPGFKVSHPTKVSWGQVFAHILRNPDIARKAGFLQSSSITLTPPNADIFKNGGWLYVDITDTSDFFLQSQAEPDLIKKYAARIPPLTIGKDRNVFAAIQFPVLTATNPTPAGNFDQIFLEASEYDTGFAKIVHTYQPVNGNILKEFEDPESLPRKDLGVRLGWDDEQLVIWHNRQMSEDPDLPPGSKKRVDAPMGVSKYRIDARLAVPAGSPVNPWTSLANVKATSDLAVGPVTITTKNEETEFGTEVYPSQLDGNKASDFWLPSYFTQWTGRSLVIPDVEAAILHNAAAAGAKVDQTYEAVGLRKDQITTVAGVLKIADLPDLPGETSLDLRYSKIYDFRVRLTDFTGGGPVADDNPEPDNQGPAPISTLHFKRYVAPGQIIFPDNTVDGSNFTGASINIFRPRLGYPAVVFTGKYNNPITLLQADADAAISVPNAALPLGGTPGRDFGLLDPDVDRVEVTVEVKSLLMDNQLSTNGREAYIQLYQTHRTFAVDFSAELDIPVVFKDANVLSLGDPTDLLPLGLNPGDIDLMDEIVLPTSRDIRITLRAVCQPDMNYFGSDLSYNGLPISFLMRQESAVETNLFVGTGAAEQLQAVYLQPDAPPLAATEANILKIILGDLNNDNPPDLIQRFAGQAGVLNKNYTLVGQLGRQIQFGASRNIRHSLSPDCSNITFSTKSDLLNHWLVTIKLILNRDWTWDAMAVDSFLITRIMKFGEDGPITGAEVPVDVGYIRLGDSANVNSLNNPNRLQMDLMFIDAVEPKPIGNNFPDIIELQYQVIPQFRISPAPVSDGPLTLNIILPVTTCPSQIPELASAGIALSPYVSKDNYSATEAREKYLWLEFKEGPRDPYDAFFIRLLNYAPDPLLSNVSLELLENTYEPPLPIDPELMKVVTSGNDTDDDAGLDAMQELNPAVGSDKYYWVPLPHGLNASSPELFGMFTYEIRVGHYKHRITHKKKWCTAKGRHGRALSAAGVQHPAPTLFCIVTRNEKLIEVSAPHAMAVYNGHNVTAKPPKTEIWALLYAQVIQADGLAYRNILLGEKMLVTIHPQNDQELRRNKDAVVYSAMNWSNKEVEQVLMLMGLPIDSPLSVLCVEMMPRPETYLTIAEELNESVANAKVSATKSALNKTAEGKSAAAPDNPYAYDSNSPLSESLGRYRILRTSPLTKVPYVCCT